MLKNDWGKKICAEFKAKGCHGCPLKLHRIGEYACRANHHWSKEREEWVADDTVLRTDNAK